MPWKEHAGAHFADPDEAGQVCQFEVENLHATQWQFKEGFTCGNSAKRIVMCEKAFEVFKKVLTDTVLGIRSHTLQMYHFCG